MSPNDSDPPDYVTGDTEENALLDKVYEKFPWLPGLGEREGELYEKMQEGQGSRPRFLDTRSILVGPLAVEAMLQFVINEAVQWGQRDAKQGMGEYIDVLDGQLHAALQDLREAQNVLEIQKEIRRLLREHIDCLSECIRMVLAAFPPELRERAVWARDEHSLWEIVQGIDWDRLEEVHLSPKSEE